MISKELLLKLDKNKIPNWSNIDPAYLGREWDPTNDYAVPRDWGSTGYIYDSSKIKRELKTWADYFDAAANEASGQTSALDTSDNVLGPYFWANGISWNTEKEEDLDAAEKFLVDEFAPHIKAFDSYPSTAIAEGAYMLSAAWNGDARQAYVRIADAGGDPEPWKWVLGLPTTEIWMDHYAITADAKNPDGAYAWINWMLEPDTAFRDLVYIGYNMTVAEHRGAGQGGQPREARHDLLHARAVGDDGGRHRQHRPEPQGRDLQQHQGCGRRLSMAAGHCAGAARRGRRLRAPKFLLAIPGFVWYGFFYAIPVLFIVINSFGYKPGVGEKGSVRLDRLSFDNYRVDLDEAVPPGLQQHDGHRRVGHLALRTSIGLPVAYFIAVKAGRRMKALLLVLVIVPFWMSFFVRTSAWKIVFAKLGFLNNLLLDWNIRDSPIDIIGSKPAVCWPSCTTTCR